MKRIFNLVGTKFVSASLVLGCSLILTKSVSAEQSYSQSNYVEKSSQLIAQSCRNIELRPNGRQNLSIKRDRQWTTCNYRLSFQSDGNLVLYSPSGNAIWASGTDRRGVELRIQTDGNVVIYDRSGRSIWATNTDGNPNSIFAIQADGNLVVYTQNGRGQVIWTSNTARQPQNNQPKPQNNQASGDRPLSPLVSLPEPIENCRFDKVGSLCSPKVSSLVKHAGVDYFTNAGTEVRAICDGVVEYSAPSGVIAWNRFVIIKHNNCGGKKELYAYYGHINSNLNKGNSVKKGQGIGTVATLEDADDHLHFGLATKYFDGKEGNKWGYQGADLTSKGWINPESFGRNFGW